MQKLPSVDLKFDHAAPALLDELFKLDVIITSTETELIEATLCADIKNSEGAGKSLVMYNTESRPHLYQLVFC